MYCRTAALAAAAARPMRNFFSQGQRQGFRFRVLSLFGDLPIGFLRKHAQHDWPSRRITTALSDSATSDLR